MRRENVDAEALAFAFRGVKPLHRQDNAVHSGECDGIAQVHDKLDALKLKLAPPVTADFRDHATPTFRAYQFPFDASLSIATSEPVFWGQNGDNLANSSSM